MTDQLGKRFIELVARHRHLDPAALNEVASARVFLADQALSLKLVDSIGYMSDSLKEARTLSNLPEAARVVVYRRIEYPNDNIYNPVTSYESNRPAALVDVGLSRLIPSFQSGFYYLWLPAVQ
jgi:protease-4